MYVYICLSTIICWEVMQTSDGGHMTDYAVPDVKSKLYTFLWNHFLNNFDPNDNCTLCPCRIVVSFPVPVILMFCKYVSKFIIS